jgi:hypothetical protein
MEGSKPDKISHAQKHVKPLCNAKSSNVFLNPQDQNCHTCLSQDRFHRFNDFDIFINTSPVEE